MLTRDIQSILNVPYYALAALLRNHHIPAPVKNSAGDYVWTDADLENARKALASTKWGKRKDSILA